MAGRFLASSASSRSSSFIVRPFTDSHLGPLKRYSKASSSEKEGSVKKSGRSNDFIGERAPSTAKEFENVAEQKQKLKEAEQGRESQTKSEEKAAKKSG